MEESQAINSTRARQDCEFFNLVRTNFGNKIMRATLRKQSKCFH